MALIRTASEARAALPRVLSNLGNNANLPDFAAAELKYLVPIIGFDQYSTIDEKINDDPPAALTDAETALLPYLRRVVAFFAYLDDMGTDNAKITDNGIRTTESANMPRVFGWQYKELKNTLQAKAYDAVEVLLRFLFENKADYSDWTDSAEYSTLNGLLIKTGTDFDTHYRLFQPMRSYWMLKVLIDEVQEDLVKPAIGDELMTWLLELTPDSDEEKAIVKLVKKAVAYMTIRKACQHYSVRFDASGFTITSGDNENPETAGRQQSDIALFEMKKNACEKDGLTYFAKFKKAMATYRVTSVDGDYNDAYDAGPMVNYSLAAVVRDRKNDVRKGFRF